MPFGLVNNHGTWMTKKQAENYVNVNGQWMNKKYAEKVIGINHKIFSNHPSLQLVDVAHGKIYMPEINHRVNKWMLDKVFRRDKDVKVRLEEQQRTDLGQPVWFSRMMSLGRVQHWVLIIGDRRYELRKIEPQRADMRKIGPAESGGTQWRDSETPEGQYIYRSKAKDGNSDDGRYEFRATPYTLDLAARDANIAQTGFPEDGTFHICLIGWTDCDQVQLELIGEKVMQDFPRYQLIGSNCQTFLRKMADDVLVEPKATDYIWFQEEITTAYQWKRERPTPPPKPSVEAGKHALAHSHAVSHGGHIGHSAHDANYINMLNMQTIPGMNGIPMPGSY